VPEPDLGWKKELEFYAGALLPWKWWKLGKARVDLTRLRQIRLIWLSLVLSALLYLIPLLSIKPLDGDGGSFPQIIIGAGLASLATGVMVRNQPLKGDSAQDVLASFTQRFYIGFAVAELPMLLAFVSVFVQGSGWLYLLGLFFGLIGLALTGPLAVNLKRHDRLLRDSGSRYRLTEILTQPIGPPPSG